MDLFTRRPAGLVRLPGGEGGGFAAIGLDGQDRHPGCQQAVGFSFDGLFAARHCTNAPVGEPRSPRRRATNARWISPTGQWRRGRLYVVVWNPLSFMVYPPAVRHSFAV